MNFFGRVNELAELEKSYKSSQFEFTIIYGRRTSQIRLRPFTFFETKEMLKGMDKEDIAVIHSATGGVADYLSFVDKNLSLDENLTNLFLNHSGRLFEEPINLLNQELKSPEIYNQIIYAIANGATKNVEISDKTNISSGSLTPYINKLIELGIIKKDFLKDVKDLMRNNEKVMGYTFEKYF